MIATTAKLARPLLFADGIRQTRRNHGLEHATIHLLARRVKNLRVAGRSDATGFYIFGDVETAALERAAHDALNRMRSGEHKLAVHPNCGTNLLTTAGMTTLVGVIGLGGRDRALSYNRISWTMTAMLGALILSRPLGMALQEHFTTEGDPGDLEISGVTHNEIRLPFTQAPLTVHRVSTTRG